MLIQVTDEIRFRYEDKNYTLEKLRIVQEGKNAGKHEWDAIGHYGDIKTAATSLLVRHIGLLMANNESIKDVKSLIDAIDFGADLIAQACRSHVEEKS